MQLVEQITRERMDAPSWEAAGAEAVKPPLTPMLNKNFGQDAPGRVAGAEEEYVIGLVGHHAGFRASMLADTT